MSGTLGLNLTRDDSRSEGVGFEEVETNGHTSVPDRAGHIHIHESKDVEVVAAFADSLAEAEWPADATHAIWIGAKGGASPEGPAWPWTPDTREVSGGRLSFTIVAEPGVRRKYTLHLLRDGTDVEIDPDIVNH